MPAKKPIDRQYLLDSFKKFDQEILSKKYTNCESEINGIKFKELYRNQDVRINNVTVNGQDGYQSINLSESITEFDLLLINVGCLLQSTSGNILYPHIESYIINPQYLYIYNTKVVYSDNNAIKDITFQIDKDSWTEGVDINKTLRLIVWEKRILKGVYIREIFGIKLNKDNINISDSIKFILNYDNYDVLDRPLQNTDRLLIQGVNDEDESSSSTPATIDMSSLSDYFKKNLHVESVPQIERILHDFSFEDGTYAKKSVNISSSTAAIQNCSKNFSDFDDLVLTFAVVIANNEGVATWIPRVSSCIVPSDRIYIRTNVSVNNNIFFHIQVDKSSIAENRLLYYIQSSDTNILSLGVKIVQVLGIKYNAGGTATIAPLELNLNNYQALEGDLQKTDKILVQNEDRTIPNSVVLEKLMSLIENNRETGSNVTVMKLYSSGEIKDELTQQNVKKIYDLSDSISNYDYIFAFIGIKRFALDDTEQLNPIYYLADICQINDKERSLHTITLHTGSKTNNQLEEFNYEIYSQSDPNQLTVISYYANYINSIYLDSVIGVKFGSGSNASNNSSPIGEIISYMGTTAPDKYLICDGAEYNISDYPKLAQHFTDQFGSVNYFGGDGETTFAVPDLRGEFLRGSGTATRNTGSGADVGEHQDATQHANVVSYGSSTDGWVGAFGESGEISPPWNRNADTTSGSSIGIFLGTSSNRQTIYKEQPTVFTSHPTNTAVLYCIRAVK